MLERTARLGALSGANEPLFRIASDGAVELEAEVVETDLAAMAPGDPALVRVVGQPPRDGEVRLVPPLVDPTTRLGLVRVAIANDDDLRVGSFASAVVTVDRRRALTLPASAVLSDGGTDRVQLVADGRVETRPVETGLLVEGRRKIVSGLGPGDEVVARVGAFLRDGDRVQPVSEAAAAAAAEAVLEAER